jgi:hypothetical protein
MHGGYQVSDPFQEDTAISAEALLISLLPPDTHQALHALAGAAAIGTGKTQGQIYEALAGIAIHLKENSAPHIKQKI